MSEDYKSSDISWIGNIPINWNIYRIKELFNLKTGGTPDSNEGIVDEMQNNVRWYTAPDFNDLYLLDESERSITNEAIRFNNYKLFPEDSILLVSIASIGKVALTNVDCYSNQQITALIPKNDKICNSKYLTYCIVAGMDYIKDNALYTTVPIINSQFIGDLKYPLPPIKEQLLIADYLDEKCININKLLDEIKKQIDLLKRYKASLITEKILNPNGTNKVDSGVDWIGNVQEDAKIIRLKDFSYLKGRIGWQGLTAEEFIDEGPYCVTGTDFINGKINWDTCYHISEKRYEMDRNIHLQIGDLLVTKDGTIGKLARVNELPDKACLNSHLLIIRPLDNKFINDYLYYVMSSDIFIKYYTLEGDGSTMNSLSQEKVGAFKFPVYSIEIQKEIASFLDEKTSIIDSSIQELEEKFETIKKYKKSLIYEVVTGKKRVEVK